VNLDSIKLVDDLPIDEFEEQLESEIKQEDNYEITEDYNYEFTETIECDVEIKEEPSGIKNEPIELDTDSD
jgi:hypothetical protein